MATLVGILIVILIITAIVAVSRSSKKTKMEINHMESAQHLAIDKESGFGISASELSAGDWIEDQNGAKVQVVDFKGKDLVVKKEKDSPFRISPPFNFRKA